MADSERPGSADGVAPTRSTSVRVTIVGEEYALRSDAPAAHTRELAAYVDRVIRQILEQTTVVETHKAAILAALQVTDELFQARAEARALADQMDRLSAEVRRWLPPTKRGVGAE
jgi:cell division protein ZapA